VAAHRIGEVVPGGEFMALTRAAPTEAELIVLHDAAEAELAAGSAT